MSRLFTLLAAVVPLLSACPDEQAAMEQSKWRLHAWSHGGAMLPAANGAPDGWYDPATGTLSGNAGCNRYSAPVTIEGTKLSVGALVTTKRGCIDPVVAGHETDFLRMLGQLDRWRLENGTMTVYDTAGTARLEFVADPS